MGGAGYWDYNAITSRGFRNDDMSSAIIYTSYGYKGDSSAKKVAPGPSTITIVGVVGCIAVVVAAAVFAVKKFVKRSSGNAEEATKYGVLFQDSEAGNTAL